MKSLDGCEICNGNSGGVLGNENIINGHIVCDYCHAAIKKMGIMVPAVPAPVSKQFGIVTEITQIPTECMKPQSGVATYDPNSERAELIRLLHQRYTDTGDTLARKAAWALEQS